jgi:hypothetical protein
MDKQEYLEKCDFEQEKLRALLIRLHNESSPSLSPIQLKIKNTKEIIEQMKKAINTEYQERNRLINEEQRIYNEKMDQIERNFKYRVDDMEIEKSCKEADLMAYEKELSNWNRKYGDTRSIVRKTVDLMDELKKQLETELHTK